MGLSLVGRLDGRGLLVITPPRFALPGLGLASSLTASPGGVINLCSHSGAARSWSARRDLDRCSKCTRSLRPVRRPLSRLVLQRQLESAVQRTTQVRSVERRRCGWSGCRSAVCRSPNSVRSRCRRWVDGAACPCPVRQRTRQPGIEAAVAASRHARPRTESPPAPAKRPLRAAAEKLVAQPPGASLGASVCTRSEFGSSSASSTTTNAAHLSSFSWYRMPASVHRSRSARSIHTSNPLRLQAAPLSRLAYSLAVLLVAVADEDEWHGEHPNHSNCPKTLRQSVKSVKSVAKNPLDKLCRHAESSKHARRGAVNLPGIFFAFYLDNIGRSVYHTSNSRTLP